MAYELVNHKIYLQHFELCILRNPIDNFLRKSHAPDCGCSDEKPGDPSESSMLVIFMLTNPFSASPSTAARTW